MELRVLKYFLTVAREENITRAAELLHVSQPTISRQLMQLEQELGIQLFRRGSHSMILTDDGKLLRRRAQELVELAERTERDFSARQSELSGEIAIGGGEMRANAAFARAFTQFCELHPHVRFTFFSASADLIAERIDSGTLDLGLLCMPVDTAKYSFLRLSEQETWGALVRDGSPLSEKSVLTSDDLSDIPLLMSGRTPVQRELANWFGPSFERLNIIGTYNLKYNAALLVREGLGAAIGIRLDCDYAGTKFIPFSPELRLGSVLVWKKHETLSPAVSALIDFLHASPL